MRPYEQASNAELRRLVSLISLELVSASPEARENILTQGEEIRQEMLRRMIGPPPEGPGGGAGTREPLRPNPGGDATGAEARPPDDASSL